MVKLRSVKDWRDAMANPPRCCLSCRHYLADEWRPDNVCTAHDASPPQAWAEEENTCEEWQELVPF